MTTMNLDASATLVDRLDAEELLMLGLRASAQGADALAYFKLAIEKRPDDARAHWAIAAEYASFRMTDRAQEHFARSLELDPRPPIARFQYGLLALTGGDAVQARAIWEPLDALADGDPVRLFKDGMLELAADRFADALTRIQRAMAVPGVEPALRRDMQMIVANIEAVVAARASQADASEHAADEESVDEPSIESRLALSAYGTGNGHPQ